MMRRVFDGHSDLLYDAVCRRSAGETGILNRYHHDALRRGGVEGLVLALWPGTGQEAFWGEDRSPAARTARMMDCARKELTESQWLKLVRSSEETKAVTEAGNLYAFLAMEGMDAVETPADIDLYADFGARIGMLTWNHANRLAVGAGGDPDEGLTALGRAVLRRMEERSILIDVSHLNDGGFRDVIRLVRGPVIASHSNSRALCGVPRNLTDEQLRAIRDTGGVVGVNVYHAFVHEDPACQTVEMLARHTAHMADVMGIDHVACGFDFCGYMGPGNEGVVGLEDCSHIPDFFWELERLGMTETEQELVARKNLMRVLA